MIEFKEEEVIKTKVVKMALASCNDLVPLPQEKVLKIHEVYSN